MDQAYIKRGSGRVMHPTPWPDVSIIYAVNRDGLVKELNQVSVRVRYEEVSFLHGGIGPTWDSLSAAKRTLCINGILGRNHQIVVKKKFKPLPARASRL